MRINNKVKQHFWQNWWKPKWPEKKISETWIRKEFPQDNTCKKWYQKKKYKYSIEDFKIWETIEVKTWFTKNDVFYKWTKDEVYRFETTNSRERKDKLLSYSFIEAMLSIRISEVWVRWKDKKVFIIWEVIDTKQDEEMLRKFSSYSTRMTEEKLKNHEEFKTLIIWKEVEVIFK